MTEAYINEPNLESSNEYIANFVINAYSGHKSAVSKMHTNFKKWLNMYNQKFESSNSKKAYRSTVYVPLVFSQIATLAPHIMNTIFSTSPIFKLEDELLYRKEEREALEKIIDLQQERISLYSKLDEFILKMLIYGTAIAKVYWDGEPSDVSEVSGEHKIDKGVPTFVNIDNENFMIDPKANQMDGFYKGHIFDITLEQLKADQESFDYINLDTLSERSSTGSTYENRIKDDKKIASGINVKASDTRQGMIRCIEFWSSDNKNLFVVAIDYSVTIRKLKNPFKHGRHPFTYARFSIVPGQFWGKGIPEILQGQQRQTNTIVNQRNANINVILNKMWKVKRDSGINEAELESRPLGVIHVDEVDDVTEIVFKDVTEKAYSEVLSLEDSAQKAVGTKFLGGQTSNPTVGGTQLNMSAETVKVQDVFKRLEDTALKPMINMWIALNNQSNKSKNYVKIFNEGNPVKMELTKDAFDGAGNFYSAGVRNLLSKEQKVHQMNNYMVALRPFMEFMLMEGFDVKNWSEDMYEAMGLRHFSRYWNKQEENKQTLLQQMLMNGGIEKPQDQTKRANVTDSTVSSNNLNNGGQSGGIQGVSNK